MISLSNFQFKFLLTTMYVVINSETDVVCLAALCVDCVSDWVKKSQLSVSTNKKLITR